MVDSLRFSSGNAFVANPAALRAVAFRPEDISLGDYVFLPFVRTGLSAAIAGAPIRGRATVTAAVDVLDSSDPAARHQVSRSLTLHGPADVTGIDPAQIIRREPAPGTGDAEQGYLAHVEFARPDLPWLVSPRPAEGDTCPPWLALVVCEAAVSHVAPSDGERPASLWTRKGQLQSLTDTHQFCHAQVVGAAMDGNRPMLRGPGQDTVETRLSDDHGPANLSRILCPRRLDDGVDYIAALVPAFAAGVAAGLGLSLADAAALDPAWTRAPGDDLDDIRLPVYDHWSFRTAPGGDFRALAERIKGVAAPWNVGRLRIDLSRPGGDLTPMPEGADGSVQVLECALYSPASNGPVPPQPWPQASREALRQRVNAANMDQPDLPRVGARLYARYQRAANRIADVFATPGAADADWFAQLNTDPMHRIVAGLGARVVQKDQEQLMQAAWAQVEGIRRANQIIAWASLAQRVNVSITRRHLEPLDQGRLMQVTRNVHGRIRDVSAQRSVAAAVTFSRTADATLAAAFRRMLRPDGPLSHRAGLPASALGRVVAGAAGFRDHRIAVTLPDGIASLSEAGRGFFPAELIARVMNVPVARAGTALAQRIATLARTGTAITRLQEPQWSAPVVTRIGDAIGAHVLDQIGAGLPPVRAGQRVSGAEQLAQIAVGVQMAGGVLAVGAKTRMTGLEKLVARQDIALRTAPVAVSVGARNLGTTRGVPTRGGPPGTRRGPVIFDRPVEVAPAVKEMAADIRFESDLSRGIAGTLVGLNRIDKVRFVSEVQQIVGHLTQPPRIPVDLGPLMQTRPGLLAQIDPVLTARTALRGRFVTRPGFVQGDWFERLGLAPIMAAPVFNRPMYSALADMDRDWLVPGLGTIAERDFVTLLSINARFAESFLIGASDEMGRELLWRNYPTDQRGTYFRRFWDADADELTSPIHRFARSSIGQHFRVGGDRAAGALALVMRAELLRRFPDTFVAAMRARPVDGPPQFLDQTEAPILFHAHLDPDYVVVGFGLTAGQIADPQQNWWFVLAQHPTAPRFGLASNASVSTARNDLDWADFGTIPPGGFLTTQKRMSVADPSSRPETVQWPGHAGIVARVLLTNPIRAAWRAKTLIESIPTPL
ncbi:MAG: hypothetical protein ACK41U_03210 [Paracoccus sp. (in: a-proteobacteria)]|uniref:hypothetical protein n=1 Tax=Paracoccus sp. TaxID=267 RepID=UPI00391D859A